MKYQKEKLGKNHTYYSNNEKTYIGINLTKEVKGLCLEKYITLKKVIKKDANK